MISRQPHGSVVLRTITLAAFGFIASSSFPLLAQSGTWTATGTLNFPRTGHTATLLAIGQVLVASGEDSSNNLVPSAELYNPLNGKVLSVGSSDAELYTP